jgi:hypothetical protein
MIYKKSWVRLFHTAHVYLFEPHKYSQIEAHSLHNAPNKKICCRNEKFQNWSSLIPTWLRKKILIIPLVDENLL